MNFQLEAYTEAGARFVELAEQHQTEVAVRAAEHDREGTFPFEAIESMKASGFLAATVPVELGGLGLTSARDLAVGLGRLARGDGSIAIATNMHLTAAAIMARNLAAARAAGEDGGALAFTLEAITAGTIIMANISEAGTDNRSPLVTLTPGEGGWRLDGRKIFGTLSPVADVFLVSCRSEADDGTPEARVAVVLRGTEGMTIQDDWDALGMRASGSHGIVYDDVFVPANMVDEPRPWGRESEGSIVSATVGNFGLFGAFLGIAERAQHLAIHTATTRTKAPSGRPIAERHGIQRLIAESEIDLAVCRSLVGHVGRLIDRVVVGEPAGTVPLADLQAVNAESQATKFEVNRRAIDIVDRALTVSGGAGYYSTNELSRLYRDVRAGPFMQPYSPNEAHEYIGKVTLGLDPTIDH